MFESCSKLKSLFRFLQVFGLKYSAIKSKTVILINFLLGVAKLGIWKIRRNKMFGKGWTNVVLNFKGLVESN